MSRDRDERDPLKKGLISGYIHSTLCLRFWPFTGFQRFALFLEPVCPESALDSAFKVRFPRSAALPHR
ncbi:hypothetical protein Mth01_50340 [Sphaerimonospora thailandensis]|uniref:Uncharacterized protein n=1 Tax=Sphaerimonospora thailandensis TaxID=795644 RepID=A0A8J3W2G8_9ACTN|nr:hypothetical protein Mth01_50340 [Sphaerimonospora thailandensis]